MPAESTTHITFTENTVTADGFDIRYAEAGQGAPLVFLHGAGGLVVAPAHRMLAREFRVVLIEIPGFGASAPNRRSTSTKELATTVHEAARGVVGDRYTVIGTSFGSRIASWVAVQHPDEVEGLMMLAPTGILPGTFEPPTGERMVNGIRHLYAHPETARPLVDLDLETANKHAELVGRLLTPRDAELEDAYRTLTVPTVVLIGTEDRRTPTSLGRRYVELNREIAVLFVYDAGHVLEEERPEAVADVIANFARHKLGVLVNNADNRLFP
ncbi:alpha/beta fold hydrolase [Nonomuraea lactucae]|uniref:alpha/beta fold hydrolase n=1 Tax=Nonomuraea lactucae TaxID=2249762 RepID=UPI000DE24C8E|nr:alpha/beta hydrolase [Nonomuraea lactucae]